jgi:hypothetical protein
MIRVLQTALGFVACVSLAPVANAGPISSVSTNDTSLSYVVESNGLSDGVDAFSDSGETWTGLPSFLNGADYVRTGQGDNSNSDLEVTVNFDADGTLYTFHSDDIALPTWLSNDFSDTGSDLTLSGSVSGTYSIFGQSLAGGSDYTLLDNDPDTGNTGLMYGIAAVSSVDEQPPRDIPAPASFLFLAGGLIGLGAFAGRRRQ